MSGYIMGSHGYVPFRAWLYQQRQQPTPIGNIARAVMVDRCLIDEGTKQINGYVRHFLQVHHASAEDVAALTAAWSAYQQYKFQRLQGQGVRS